MTMGAFTSYTFVAGLVLLSLYLVYKWLLANEKQPLFNRCVLLGTYVVSALVPAFVFSGIGVQPYIVGETVAGELQMLGVTAATEPAASAWTDKLPALAVGVYLAGVAVMTIFTLVSWCRLALTVRHGQRIKKGRYTLVLLEDCRLSPFSWMHYIVMGREDYDTAGEMIMAHEMKHIDCRHPIDLVVGQLGIIFLWYNPASWLMLDELRSVHEYQADMAVIADGHDVRAYQMLLIKKAVGQSFPVLANSLNNSKLKKRITMMLKSSTSKSRRVRALALVPAVAVALAVVNLPFVSCGIDSVSDVGKDSEKIPADEMSPKAYVEVETIDDTHLNPEDIESITVYRDSLIVIEAKEGTVYHVKNPNGIKVEAHISDPSGDATEGRVAGMSSIEKESPLEKMPEFPGGNQEMMKWLMKNVQYPEDALKAEKQGRVIVDFVVGADGSIRDAAVNNPVWPSLDAEAIRVVKAMPRWTPGKKDGCEVDVKFSVPIEFKLQ